MTEFRVGDNAVYPGYGVGQVSAIETKEMGGTKQSFYVIKILATGMKVLVPTGNTKQVGLRPIISQGEANKVLGVLKQKDVKIDNQTWNRRYRKYMDKIKTGSVYEIAEVLRDLYFLKVEKELSFGERKMLETARDMLLKELSLATTPDKLRQNKDVSEIFNL